MLFANYQESEVIIRVAVALILGIFLGIQREHRKIIEKSVGLAGFRTHTIVTVGAAVTAAIGALSVSEDPLRMAASILTGVGFIGAGTIIADKDRIKGLVNAATIWVAATIGIAAGLGYHLSAILVTAITIVVLELKRFEKIE